MIITNQLIKLNLKMINIKNFIEFNESMSIVSDLASSVGLFIYNNTLTLYDIENDKIYGFISLLLRGDIYYFISIAAEHGFGALILEFAMQFAFVNNRGVMVARDGDIREEAFIVWEKFYKRNDINKEILKFDNNLFNFAIITGEEEFESDIQKEVEYDYHKNEGYEEKIIIYNTMMSMKPNKDYYNLIKYAEESKYDYGAVSDIGYEFFSYMYS